MKNYQQLIGAIIIAVALIIGAYIIASAIQESGGAIGSQITSAILQP